MLQDELKRMKITDLYEMAEKLGDELLLAHQEFLRL